MPESPSTAAPLEFGPDVEPHHHRIDPTAWDDLYVVGDVHGCRDAFERLLDAHDDGTSLFVVVGDLVRKGPDSAGVLDVYRERENVRSVRGNNEQKLLDGRTSLPGLDEADLALLADLPVVISWPGNAVVHGGIDHRMPLTEHTVEELLTTRSLDGGGYERPFWFEERSEGARVFFGHTVLAEPFETPWAVGLDTGCVYGGRLTAYRCSDGAFVGVDPGETHQSRSADDIVNPRQTVDR